MISPNFAGSYWKVSATQAESGRELLRGPDTKVKYKLNL
jgi:hypothetical protein